MTRSVNKVILIGNIGQPPVVNYLPNGEAVANVSLATAEAWKDKSSGKQQERTEWHRLVFYRRLAEVVSEYTQKGSKLYIEGRLQTRSWEQDGSKRYATDIVVNQMVMLDSNTSTQQAPKSQQQKPSKAGPSKTTQQQMTTQVDDFDDDIPF